MVRQSSPTMGLTHVTAIVNPLIDTNDFYQAEFLVDTGSVDCLLDGNELRRIGVKPQKKKVYELADGSIIEYEVGYCRIGFMGDETVTEVIFGPEKVEPILGVVALENTGFSIEPVTRTLKKNSTTSLK